MADENKVEVRFLDDPRAPDIFASNATGFFHIGETVMITLEAAHVDHSTSPGPINRVVVGRLVMPLGGANALAVGLFDFLKTQGLIREEDGASVQ